jgi:hypothetical protein
MVGITFPWFFAFLYLLLPAVAAILISTRGPDRYLAEIAPKLVRLLRWLGGVMAYMSFLTDRVPADASAGIQLEVVPGGRPTLQGALARLVASLPEALVVALLCFVQSFVWLIAFVLVLVKESYPESLWSFQRGLLRWQLRLIAYHASIVEPMPPFAFETGPEPPARSI